MKNRKIFPIFIIGLLAGMLIMYFFKNYKIEKIDQNNSISSASVENSSHFYKKEPNNSSNIEELTEEKRVITYVKKYKKLPNYYITKSEARKQGWEASKGNLCNVLPGKAIGGDKFSNREKKLPTNQQYYEADVNYTCGRRGSDRIVFNRNGDVYLTKNHYKSFKKQ